MVIIVSLWTVGVLARPLNGWKVGLVGVLTAFAAVDVFVPALARDVYLLSTDAVDLGLAAAIGCAGALFVEITHRSGVSRTRGPGPGRGVGRR